MAKLHKFRTEQDAARKGVRSSFQPQEAGFTLGWEAGDPCTSSSSSAQDALQVAQHEERWVAFEASLIGTEAQIKLTYDDIPWVPFGDDLRRYLLVVASMATGGVDRGTALRRAYTRTCLRWHPDKFQHKFAKHFDGEEWGAVAMKVQQVSQLLNQAWAEVAADLGHARTKT